MGKKKIQILRIADDRTRMSTFCKRKKGLIKKAIELSILCGIHAYLLLFDPNNGKFVKYSSHQDFTEKLEESSNSICETLSNDDYHRYIEIRMPSKNFKKRTDLSGVRNKKRYKKIIIKNKKCKKEELTKLIENVKNVKNEKPIRPNINEKMDSQNKIQVFKEKLRNYSSNFKISIPIQPQFLYKMDELNQDISRKNSEIIYMNPTNNDKNNVICPSSYNISESLENNHQTFFGVQSNLNDHPVFSDNKQSPRLESSSYINNMKASFDFSFFEPGIINPNPTFISEYYNPFSNLGVIPEKSSETNFSTLFK